MSALRLKAVGDISFEGARADTPSAELFRALAPTLHDSDLVVANLECVLAAPGTGISGKCTLRGAPGWAAVMKDAGIGIVTLANNHIMDYGRDGLESTMRELDAAGIRHFGAGLNRAQACAPLIVELQGRRVALLGRSAVIVSAPTYADDTTPGVAFLDSAETCAAIRAARSHCDTVVLVLHWGVEEYSYPAPSQRALARSFIDAGANAIIGHHPHVLQGTEQIGAGAVIYSLGNFVFDEFEWSYRTDDGRDVPQFSPLSAPNRDGMVATLTLTNGAPTTVTMGYTRIQADGQVVPDERAERAREITRFSRALARSAYPLRWRLYSMRREWQLRLGERMSVRNLLGKLHKLRPRHVWEVLVSLRRSARIVSERSSNPYE